MNTYNPLSKKVALRPLKLFWVMHLYKKHKVVKLEATHGWTRQIVVRLGSVKRSKEKEMNEACDPRVCCSIEEPKQRMDSLSHMYLKGKDDWVTLSLSLLHVEKGHDRPNLDCNVSFLVTKL